MPGNTVFITGSQDYLGQVLLDQLILKGYRLKALVDGSQQMKPGVEWVQGDLLSPSTYEHHLEGCDMVIHLAQYESYSRKDQPRMYAMNLSATRDLLNASLAYHVPHFLFLSSAFSLTRSSNPDYIGMDTQGNPFFYSYFAQLKFECEMEVWRAEAEGLKTCILNIPMVPGSDLFKSYASSLLRNNHLRVEHPIAWIGTGHLARVILNVIEQELWSSQFLVYSEISSFSIWQNETDHPYRTSDFKSQKRKLKQFGLQCFQYLSRILYLFKNNGPYPSFHSFLARSFQYQAIQSDFMPNQEEVTRLQSERIKQFESL